MLTDPFMRETVAPLASLTPAAAAEPPSAGDTCGPTPGRQGVLLGRSDTLGRGGLAPALIRSSLSRGEEPRGANQVPPRPETLPAELQVRQMLHELPPNERHLLQAMPPHVQVRS